MRRQRYQLRIFMNESVCARVGVQVGRLEDRSGETELSRRQPESRSGATAPELEVPGKVPPQLRPSGRSGEERPLSCCRVSR